MTKNTPITAGARTQSAHELYMKKLCAILRRDCKERPDAIRQWWAKMQEDKEKEARAGLLLGQRENGAFRLCPTQLHARTRARSMLANNIGHRP